jgi:hypothetical protein
MVFLPYDIITYKTKLERSEIIKRLSEITDQHKLFAFARNADFAFMQYKGKITETGFEIVRITSYRNTSKPIIIGTIESKTNSTTIKIKIQMQLYAKLTLLFLSFISGIPCIYVLTQITKESTFDNTEKFPFILLFGLYTFALTFFKFESWSVQEELQALFEADIID